MKPTRTLAVAIVALSAMSCLNNPGPPTPEPTTTTNTQSVMVKADEGGEVAFGESGQGGGTLTIPPGALAEDTLITVEVLDPENTPANDVVKGKIYKFGPEGLKFDPPAVLEVDSSADPFTTPGAISKFEPNLGLWDQYGPTGSQFDPNLGLWDQTGDSGRDYEPNLGLWDGDPGQMATGVTGFSSFATTRPNHGVYSCGTDAAGAACCWGLRSSEPASTSTGFTKVAAGAWSECGLLADGSIECWGSNPPAAPAEVGFEDITIGRGHACALAGDGTVDCFMAPGLDYDVPDSALTDVSKVTAGDFHACALRVGGEVSCWGVDRDGQLAAPTGNFTQIDAGARHTCAVTDQGTLQCWGSEISGINDAPTRTDRQFTQVSVGVFAACALTDVGGVICWGADTDVVTGTPSGTGYTQVVARHRHACAVAANGTLECWGQDISGSLSPPAGCGFPVDDTGNNNVSCEPGYEPSGNDCVDIDECVAGTDNCDANATCTNNDGGFDCACDAGFSGDGVTCTDDDECATGADNCDANATCTNEPGTFSCACDAGYTGDGVTCDDEDECAAGTDNCDANATCTNNVGGFDCACGAGFTGDGVTCADDDECTLGTDNCDANATCTNEPGTFSCACDAGFSGDGVTCMDDDECVLGTDNCDPNAQCTNNVGSFDCACLAGFTGDGVTCMDDDECVLGTDNCNADATCTNTPGSFTCMCNAGFTGDGIDCTDDDECVLGTDNCDANATCTNTPGSFTCMCNNGFTGDGTMCTPVATPADAVATGAIHNCAIVSGAIWCWGDNLFGQLGDGTNTSSIPPVRVGAASDWTSITSGPDHNCAINSGGELWCWGSNSAGQLGDSTLNDSNVPVRENTNATNWSQVSAGGGHTCAINTSNELYCWGDGFGGQLGNGVLMSQASVPTRETTNATNWVAVSAGGDHTCARDSVGTVSCWGANFAGQMGDGNTGIDNATPTAISGGPWDEIAAGGAHSCAVGSGEAWCWGSNIGGQLGVGDTNDRDVPTRVGADTNWSLVAAGGDNSCAIKDDGTLWCWGFNIEGQVGVGDTTDRSAPTQVGVATDWSAVDIPALGAHVCGLQGGAVLCWGSNFDGELGTESSRAAPGAAIDPGSTWTSISAFAGEDVPVNLGPSSYACGVKDGGPFCWGWSAYDATLTGSAAAVSGTSGNTDWTLVSSASTHACGLQNGAPRCWGDNADGGLGNGTNAASASPVVVQGTGADTDWTAVAAGSGFSCGVKSGALWCWGRGDEGQLGDGASTSRNTPIQTGSGTGTAWSTVSAGHTHACALHNSELYCWGDNAFGQLGNGTQTPETSVPATPTVMGTNFVVVAAGFEHTCVIDAAGNLMCAGDNSFGELGDGSSSPSLSFVTIGAAQAPWSAVAVGRDNTCGVAAGVAYCWGSNQFGQVGDGTTNEALTPTAVSTAFTDWVEVTPGDIFTCGRRANGDALCWGDNGYGQLGDGSLRFLTPRVVTVP